MGDRVLSLGGGACPGCGHPSLCSPEGQGLGRKPDLSTDLCFSAWGYSGQTGGGGATLSGACRRVVTFP